MTTPGNDAVAPATPAVSIRDVTKRFGPVAAVDGVSLDVAPGEFFSLLGPSGSSRHESRLLGLQARLHRSLALSWLASRPHPTRR